MLLIHYLRAKAIAPPSSLVAPPNINKICEKKGITINDFHRLVEYYGITPFLYPLKFVLHRDLKNCADEVSFGPEPSVACATWTTFCLQPVFRNGRTLVESFDVLLGSIDRPQIGWADLTLEGFHKNDTVSDHKGVGEVGWSVALDRDRGGIFFQGQCKVPVSNLALQAGTRVTCQQTITELRWLVDGDEIASIPRDQLTLPVAITKSYGYKVPVISGKGQWQLKEFVYI